MSANLTLGPWQAAFETRESGDREPVWLRERREAAWTRFQSLGFPTSRDEDWRHTHVSQLTRSEWTSAGKPAKADLDAAATLLEGHVRYPAAESGRMVFVNGWYAPALSAVESVPVGIEIASLAEAGDLLSTDLASLVDGETHAFQALNTALWTDGAALHVARDVDLVDPLHLVFLVVGGADRTLISPRVLVHGDVGSHLPILITWAGTAEGPALQNAVLEVELEEGARMDLLEVQTLPHTVNHFTGVRVHQGKDSTFTACEITDGARLVRADLTVHLDAEGASCRVDGITVAKARQRVDIVTNIDHAKPHCTSEQLYKGILDDHAAVAFSGKVLVRPGAQKTDARQANHNLLLSRDAVADSKPQLEIFANDVKCAHGATVGQLDEEAVFYLRSRGLDLLEARKLLVKAFAGEVVERVDHPVLHDHAKAILHTIL